MWRNDNSPRFKYRQEMSDRNNQFDRRVREGFFILVFAITVFLIVSLASYHATDPGWSRTGSGANIVNICGYLGAWVADVLLCAFGYVAYIFPLMLLYGAWISLKRSYSHEPTLFLLRSLGLFLVLVSASTLSSLHLSGAILPFGAGGVLGNLSKVGVIRIFSAFGSDLILTALLLAGLTLFSGVSWVGIIDFIGRTICEYAIRSWEKILQAKIFDWHNWRKPKAARFEPKISFAKTNDKTPVIEKPKPIKVSVKAEKERQLSFFEEDEEFPSLLLLDSPDRKAGQSYTTKQLEELSLSVELKLKDFGIDAQVEAVHPGPVVTRFELQLAAGTKVGRITALAKDLARSLSVVSVRVVEVIPGKSVIGLELPNINREIVRLREILASQQFEHARAPLAIALGKDIAGNPVIVDLAKMPHLLVAGTTGSGKSVCLNAMLLSLLYKYTPEEVRLILIDPKMLELSVYAGIPHLLTPVVTDMKEAANALRWSVVEMERRYKLMAHLGVRNIAGYNTKVREARANGKPIMDPLWQVESGKEQEELTEVPYIVVIADEYADMIMVVGKKVEELIARIAQKARASGIHLILATQRPSVDVITGLIKANIPTRIAFQVSSKIDSRTILDQSGAEQLLGYGDMLYLPPGSGVPVRIHGAFVADDEVHRVAKDLKRHGQPDYWDEILDGSVGPIVGIDQDPANLGSAEEQDPLYDQAVRIVTETRRASISGIQRRLKIGYNRAARMVEAMEVAGIVGAMESNGNREVLAPPPPESNE